MCLGIPGKIVSISNPRHRLGIVDVAGVQREINLACVIDAEHSIESCIGEWVLVHIGFAMSRINEDEAHKTLQLLSELGDVQTELDAMRRAQTELHDAG